MSRRACFSAPLRALNKHRSLSPQTVLQVSNPFIPHVQKVARFILHFVEFLFYILRDFNFMFCRNSDRTLPPYDVNSTALVQAAVKQFDTLWMGAPC